MALIDRFIELRERAQMTEKARREEDVLEEREEILKRLEEYPLKDVFTKFGENIKWFREQGFESWSGLIRIPKREDKQCNS